VGDDRARAADGTLIRDHHVASACEVPTAWRA